MKFVRHPERSKHHGAVFAQSNFQKRSTNRTFLKGKGAQRPFEDLATSFDGSCGKCYFAHESYCMSLLDPAAADALRFCFAHFAAQKFDYGLRPSLRMTHSREAPHKPVGDGAITRLLQRRRGTACGG